MIKRGKLSLFEIGGFPWNDSCAVVFCEQVSLPEWELHVPSVTQKAFFSGGPWCQLQQCCPRTCCSEISGAVRAVPVRLLRENHQNHFLGFIFGVIRSCKSKIQ